MIVINLSTNRARQEDPYKLAFTEEWLRARLRIAAFSNDKLRTVLEKGTKNHYQVVKLFLISALKPNMSKLQDIAKIAAGTILQFDSIDFRGQKNYSVLMGVLSGDNVDKPHLVQITRLKTSPNVTIVQQIIISALGKLGNVTEFKFVTYALSNNISAANSLKGRAFQKLIEIITIKLQLISRAVLLFRLSIRK